MGIKKRALRNEIDLSDQSIVYRIPKSSREYKCRQDFVFAIGFCQICGSSDLDAPHHALDGISRKDDRTMICICCSCHRAIHTKGFDTLEKTEKELVAIGWQNNKEYLEYKGII